MHCQQTLLPIIAKWCASMQLEIQIVILCIVTLHLRVCPLATACALPTNSLLMRLFFDYNIHAVTCQYESAVSLAGHLCEISLLPVICMFWIIFNPTTKLAILQIQCCSWIRHNRGQIQSFSVLHRENWISFLYYLIVAHFCSKIDKWPIVRRVSVVSDTDVGYITQSADLLIGGTDIWLSVVTNSLSIFTTSYASSAE